MFGVYDGKAVRLRTYRKEDLPTVLEYINDPHVKLNLHPGVPLPLKSEDELEWYESNGKNTNQSYSFAIERKEDGQYLGGCGYNKVDWKNSYATVGIFLGKPWLGNGYGTDTMRTLTAFIFNEMNMNKIVLNVFGFNQAAIHCYEKCGFKSEGILRQQLFRNGQYFDDVHMGLLRSEWQP
jgi:RimJ/RimL family protein N-acetyltransferase